MADLDEELAKYRAIPESWTYRVVRSRRNKEEQSETVIESGILGCSKARAKAEDLQASYRRQHPNVSAWQADLHMIELEGSVLICLFGVICLCVGASGLLFNPILDRHQVRSPICSRSQMTDPHNSWVVYSEEVKCGLAEFETTNRVAEDIPITYAPVNIEYFSPTYNRLDIIEREFVPLPAKKTRRRQGTGSPGFYGHLIENHPRSGVPVIHRDIRQIFASEYNRPRSQKCGRLAIIYNYEPDRWELEHSFQTSSGWIPQVKVVNYQSGDRNSGGNIGTDLGSFRTLRGGVRSALLQRNTVPHRLGSLGSFLSLPPNSGKGEDSYCYQRPIGPYGCVPFWCFLLSVGCLCLCPVIIYNYDGRFSFAISLTVALLALPVWFYGRISCEKQQCKDDANLHGGTIVLQKYLDKLYCCSTVMDMANVLNTDRQIAVIGALAEGSSIRSIERQTGIHRDTIMRLGVKVGQGCATLLDGKMRDLPCHYLQFDEIWGFIGKKQRNLLVDDDETEYGDVWTFCAIDAETKLVPTFRCGKRDAVTANAFVEDVASRMRTRVQVTTDALRLYVEAIERGFGADVDYGRVIKTYAHDDSIHPVRRYSAPEIVTTAKRLHMRRLTRLTYAFSKKLENFKAAAALHFAYYNLVKRHGTLRCTPAMAAGVEQTFWSVGQLVEATS